MHHVFVEICALQPPYSSADTSQMAKRGKLVRTELVSALRERLGRLQTVVDPVFDGLAVGASDGIG